MTIHSMRSSARLLAAFALLSLLLAGSAHATTTVNLPAGRYQQFDPDTGSVLSGGLLQSYLCGTTTPTSTYADSTGTVANANPVVLDGGGQASVWLNPAICYKLVQKKSDGTTIWTLDGINTAAAGTFTTLTASGAVTFSSSLTVTGTAAFGVITTSSSAAVANLNASLLLGCTWAIPCAIGTTTPNTGAFTALTATSVAATGAVSGATVTASSTDGVTSGGKIVPTAETVPWYEFGTQVDAHMWIAPRAGKVVSIKEIHSVVGGAACTVRPRKITDTSAPGCGGGRDGQRNHHRIVRLHRGSQHGGYRNALGNRL
jgi:hypothetical protein